MNLARTASMAITTVYQYRVPGQPGINMRGSQPRYGTRAAIEQIGQTPLLDTAIEMDERLLDADGFTRVAKTPSGMLREDSVHAAQCTFERSDVVTVRASVVLPTPAAPTTTTPQLSRPSKADRIASCSTRRSSSCQRRPINSNCKKSQRITLQNDNPGPALSNMTRY